MGSCSRSCTCTRACCTRPQHSPLTQDRSAHAPNRWQHVQDSSSMHAAHACMSAHMQQPASTAHTNNMGLLPKARWCGWRVSKLPCTLADWHGMLCVCCCCSRACGLRADQSWRCHALQPVFVRPAVQQAGKVFEVPVRA